MVQRRETAFSEHTVVIGAGIAGVLVARALAERGMDVSVIDTQLPQPDRDGARRGALYVRPAVDYSPETRFAHQAFLYATDYYSRLQAAHPQTPFWYQTGTLQLAWNQRERERQEKVVARNAYDTDFLRPVSREEASNLAGMDTHCGGLWYPRGGHVRHATMRTAALKHPRITTMQAEALSHPERSPSTGNWQVSTNEGTVLEAGTVICTAGASTGHWFPQLPLGSIRGQITRLNATNPELKTTVSGAGYALPPLDGAQSIGATFDRDCEDTEVRDDSHRLNLRNLNDWFPGLGSQFSTGDIRDGWVGFRSTTPDHMPIAGDCDGLHLIAGLGGKGLAYAPILARLLADSLCGEEPILDEDLRNRTAAARFL